MLRYNTITNGETEPCSASHVFGRKEGIKYFGEILGRDADAGVFDFQNDFWTSGSGAQSKRSSVRHRINRIRR